MMRKNIGICCLLILLLCSVCMFNGCGNGKLNAPSNLYVDGDTLTLYWNSDKIANGHIVSINGKEEKTREFSYSLERLKPGTYEIMVRSINSRTEEQSPWSAPYNFVREEESGLAYKQINNNTEYEVVGLGVATGDIVIEDIYRGKPVTSIGEKAFAKVENSDVTSITIGNNVKVIKAHAFFGCLSISEITIPENVTTVMKNAFQSCTNLKTVNILSSLDSIEPYTFSYSGIESIIIPQSVQAIGEYAFANCMGLSEVYIPENVQLIDRAAFMRCKSLKNVTISSENPSYLLDEVFSGCNMLESVTLPDNLKWIGKSAFEGCETLAEIIIPNGVENISAQAFLNCKSLANVKIGRRVRSIQPFAFYGTKIWNDSENLVYVDKWLVACKDKTVKKVDIDVTTTGIADQAFLRCGLTEVILPDPVKYVGTNAFNSCPSLVTVILGKNTQFIGDFAFYGCKKLTYLSCKDSNLEHIGYYAFADCEHLGSNASNPVVLPASLKTIRTYAFVNTAVWKRTSGVVYVDNWVVGVNGDVQKADIRDGTIGISDYAFFNAQQLKEVKLPDGITKIGKSAFFGCISLESMIIPETVEQIGDYAFYMCMGLKNVKLPSSLKTIGKSAFYMCASLAEVTLPEGLETIGDYAFFQCKGLKKADIPNSVTTIGNDAFYQCVSLESVKLGNNVKTVGDHAFSGCENLKNIVWNDKIEVLGQFAFYGCTSLENIVLPDSLITISNFAFSQCGNMLSVKLGSAVKYIGACAFSYCSNLAEVELSETLEYIGRSAFYSCVRIKDIVLPQSLENIDEQAFRNCKSLESVIMRSNIKGIGQHAFYACPDVTFYLEEGTDKTNFNKLWNSGFRPVIENCTISTDGYVESITKGKVEHYNEKVAVKDPFRSGYKFVGFSTEKENSEKVISLAEFLSAPEGTVFYTIWEKIQ